MTDIVRVAVWLADGSSRVHYIEGHYTLTEVLQLVRDSVPDAETILIEVA
jgi:hypothetical protein